MAPEGRAVEYQCDAVGRLSAMRLPSGGAIAFASDAQDGIISVSYPNGVRGTWQYDARDLPASISWSDRAGKVLASWSHAYDAAGNLTERDCQRNAPKRKARNAAHLRAYGRRLASTSGDGELRGKRLVPRDGRRS